MRQGWLFGMVTVVLLAVPVVHAQRGGGAGGARGAGSSGGMSFASGASHSGGFRTIPSVTVASNPSAARPRTTNPFAVYGMAPPYRLTGATGSPVLGIKPAHGGSIDASHGTNRNHHPRNPRRGTPQFLFLTGGGYYYAGPGDLDDSDGQTQDATDQRDVVAGQQDDNQQADDQQAPDDQQRNFRADAANAPMPPQEQEQAPPLPDVGSFTLVMRDGTQVDALAFTRAHDKIIYITPDGGRRTVAVSDIDSDSTQRLNEERGTPLQFPL